MNQKKVIYTLFALVAMLIVLNITLIMFVFFRHPPHENPYCDGEGRRERGQFLVTTLRFDADQEAAFDKLREEHHFIVEPIQEKIMKNKTHFFASVKDEKADSVAIDSLSKVITELYRMVDVATFYHFKKIRAICKPEQQERFDELVEEGLFMPNQDKGRGRRFKN